MTPDATPLTPNLFIGSAPLPDTRGFDVIVLCANEYQPEQGAFPHATLEHFPFDDRTDLTKEELKVPVKAARKVAEHIQAGRRVLVTCQMGRNRSALVSALALHFTTGRPGLACANHVRKRRVDPTGARALSNQGFWRALAKIPGR